MKKFLSTLVVVIMAATLAIGLTACGNEVSKHTHDYSAAWSSDETNHWHACAADGDCDAPKKDEAAHTWNDGEITTPATAEANGVKTFTCMTCNKTKTEDVKYVVLLTEQTDFNALVSEKVTEQEWRDAFNINNATVKISNNNFASTDYVYIDAPSYQIVDYVIISKDSNGNIIWIEDYNYITSPLDNDYEDKLEEYNLFATWNYPDFSNFYSSFEYDDELNAYVLKNGETVDTNAVLEDGDYHYTFATVKIINGKLAFVRCGNANNDMSEYLYNFGTTEIMIPSAE